VRPELPLLLAHGHALIAAGRDADALTYFRALERQYPQEPRAALELALLETRLGFTTEAIAAFERALAHDPETDDAIRALEGLAQALIAAERHDEAAAIQAETARLAGSDR